MSRASPPLDVLSNCLASLPLQQRLQCVFLSRRWREAVQDPCLWASLVLEPADLPFLSELLVRFGAHVRQLQVASRGGNRVQISLMQLLRDNCPQLRELSIGGFRQRELQSFCLEAPGQMASLRALSVDCDPYFTLGSFSHNTGSHLATLPAAWLRSFPNLERLSCHYLRLEEDGIAEQVRDDDDSDDSELPWFRHRQAFTPPAAEDAAEAMAEVHTAATPAEGGAAEAPEEPRAAATQARLLLPEAALPKGSARPSGKKSEASSGRDVRLKALRELRFVAVVRGTGSVWNSPRCRCDLEALSQLAPALERLCIQSPSIALGRMSRRPGQPIEGLTRASRQFCSTGLRDLLAVGHLMSSLRELEVDVLKDDTGHPVWASNSLLVPPRLAAASSQSASLSHLAAVLGVHDRSFLLRISAGEGLAEKLQQAAKAAATSASFAMFEAFATAEQHNTLKQHLECLESQRQQARFRSCGDLQLEISGEAKDRSSDSHLPGADLLNARHEEEEDPLSSLIVLQQSVLQSTGSGSSSGSDTT
eukprot:gb/GFBE01013379.1/.p1 GENE.gb/GFBE01013379.1/~~gb/GFBE01013379.1/.p1  ORF type:complete len:535 (+),score=100.61 gb/GFBE01013379.1/:1-1605(+)